MGTASSARRTRSLVAVTVMVTATLTAGMWSPAQARERKVTAPSPSPAPIAWGPCARAGLIRAGAQCGYLTVPLDYDRPDGQTIQLAVSLVRHTTPDDQYQGIMLVNPGGPGGSGLPYAALGRIVPKHAGDSYDWIGFDPRGVGASRPALTCDPNVLGANRPDYVPRTSALERTWLNRSRSYANACRSNGGALLDHLTTIEWARDMDSIRAALGADQLNYYGFSYGTYLGQVYATRYPQRVRRMVFDGTVDPRNIWYQANLNQDIAFETTVKEWFKWVALYDAVYHLGTTGEAVESHWYADQRKLRDAPAGGLVGPSEWADMFLQAGYYQGTWLDLAALWANWVAVGDPTPVIAQFQNTNNPGNDNLYAIYVGVECTDAPWPRDWDQWRRDNWRTHAQAPFYTWGNAWFNAPCAFWRARPHAPQEIDGAAAPGILMVNETLDAATPYDGSLEVRRRFPKASLIAVPGGTTHAGSLNGNDCEDDQIADYLLTGARPPRQAGDEADTTCDPLPPPDPTAASQLTTLTTNGAGAPAVARRASGLAPRLGPALGGRI